MSKADPAASITRSASKQAFYTIRHLVDPELVPDAYRAYAYFRWVDDRLDREALETRQRQAFMDRQMDLMERCYAGERPGHVTIEENMLVDLIHQVHGDSKGLQSYIRNMMAVMAFDSERRYHLITRSELDEYVRLLSKAVTDALHHFIGNHCAPPKSENRYMAAAGAHIVHMLRDTREDNSSGYYNIPSEFVRLHNLDLNDLDSTAYRQWIRERADLARKCFLAGRRYLAQIENPRCRIAGWAYIARFEVVLDIIERDGYILRTNYQACKNLTSRLSIGWTVLSQALTPRRKAATSPALPV